MTTLSGPILLGDSTEEKQQTRLLTERLMKSAEKHKNVRVPNEILEPDIDSWSIQLNARLSKCEPGCTVYRMTSWHDRDGSCRKVILCHGKDSVQGENKDNSERMP